MKKYVITESQYWQLIERKKQEKNTVNRILEDIERAEKSLNEGVLLNESIVDTIKKYAKKGLLTTAVVASLLGSGKVNAQQLQQAGVEQNKIEQAMSQEDSGDLNPEKVDRKIKSVLKRRGDQGTLNRYEKLDIAAKNQVIAGVSQRIDKLSDLDNFDLQLSNFISSDLAGDQYTKIDQQSKTIEVTTVTSEVELNVSGSFGFNSSELLNPEQLKKEIQDTLNAFTNIENIKILASSSTLRNTGDAEGKTWKELSAERAGSLVEIVEGMTYDLGGCDENETKRVERNAISYDINGENGDGTSGPPSPYESNPEVVKYYEERGIDASLWDSAAEGVPYENKEDYAQHQYVKIIITGEIVETETEEIVNYQYLVMKEVSGEKITIKKDNKTRKQGVKVQSCPMPGK
jgi:hypothetical protein